MATYASRPAWDLRARARAATSARLAGPAGLGLLLALSLFLRTRELGIGFWIDEGLSVGIADRPLGDIPSALRRDGSPPLYYTLLHFWIGLFGRGEAQVRGLSLLCALLLVPAAWWGARVVFGTRVAWIAAVLAALNPFLTQYAEEARMYALVALLSTAATTCFLRAYALDAPTAAARRPWLAGFAASVAAGRLGLFALLVVAIMWVQDQAPVEKSNVRAVTEAIAPGLAPGDLVVSTQPETVPVLAYYLPPGLRYATLTGPVEDLGVWDWRDGVDRLESTSPARDLRPLVDRLPAGHRLVLVEPITWALSRWQAPWTKLVRLRSEEWGQYLSNDPRLRVMSIQPTEFTPPRPNPVQATVLVKTR